jgi:hypothetical protein
VTIARVGQLRPSQLLYTFGVGAAIDLPHLSAIVLGLDEWDITHSEEISERRLLTAVRARLGSQVRELRLPPNVQETGNVFDDWAKIGVPVAAFPRWLRCPRCSLIGSISTGLFKFRDNPYRPDDARFEHDCARKGRPPRALPVRFLLACPRGHIDEFPWVEYTHRGTSCKNPLLNLFERGVSGRAAEIIVQCTSCDAPARSMADAFGDNAAQALPRCRGRHPHLRLFEDCEEQARAILLGASNAWFPVAQSALSIPSAREPVAQKVEEYWPYLRDIESVEVLRYARGTHPELSVFAHIEDEKLMEAIEGFRTLEESVDGAPDLLRAEWEVLASPSSAPVSDDFRLRKVSTPSGFAGRLSDVVIAERLREVVALVGFTRVAPPDELVGNESHSRPAPLTKKPPMWVPCAEVHGEGIFIQLSEEEVAEWEKRVEGDGYFERLSDGHVGWRSLRARYILLHTLAHALIRKFALECGYGAASLRERLYARTGADPMAGLLLYTAAPDSEGTLGGLVHIGEPTNLGRLLRQALDDAGLCTSDPLCAEHDPVPDNSLHGAACHACMFAAETSCESGNHFLDRSLLVDTFAQQGLGFFS